jgi:putative transcriptional regulator
MENRVRDWREQAGWSQGELARRLSVSRQTVNAVETDKYDPSLPLALRMAKLFAVPEE